MLYIRFGVLIYKKHFYLYRLDTRFSSFNP